MISPVHSLSSMGSLVQLLYIVGITSLVTGLMIYFHRYSRTGTSKDPFVLWRKYGKILIILLAVGFGYFNLDYYCTFKISTDKSSYRVGEIVEVNCSTVNPLPIPVYYRGYSRITTEMRYLNGSKVNRADLPLREAIAAAAAEEARAASGALVGKGFIMPYSERVLKTVYYAPQKIGETIVNAEYSDTKKLGNSQLYLSILEYNPVWVDVNSTGITLFLDESEYKIIEVKVYNSNSYPVRLPLYNEVITHYGTPDSEAHMVTYIDWLTSNLDIPAYSTKTIYNTKAYAAPDRTPIYFTLYGKTLRYPPE